MSKSTQLKIHSRVPVTSWRDVLGEALQVPHPTLWTHLQFRRFAQCPICILHVREFFRNHEKITQAGIQEVIIFQSSRELLVEQNGEQLQSGNIHLVADPTRQLYEAFGVHKSLLSVAHPGAWWSTMKGVAQFGMHLPSSSESMFGMPADFLVNPEGVIVAAHYGRHADDQWSVEELLQKRSAA